MQNSLNLPASLNSTLLLSHIDNLQLWFHPISFSIISKSGCCSQTMVMRILCFGEASNVKKGGELMGVGIVLLDE
ncbi:hypothetical protein Bca52824_024128 [Brassica carinata]|uniref:Uncharacterized protein n=1 Tax=Brassica carinata TaxID=52824 RepID=A0A8X7VJQ6_BRACI|nr:hypothetical protein Bca52824_024128 [Brassica carinata]